MEKPASPPTAPAAGTPTAADVAALSQALIQTRQSLTSRNFAAATAELEKAKKLPMLPEHQEKYARLEQLAHYAQEFDKFYQEALNSFQGDEEIEASGTRVKVIEVLPEYIALRGRGRTLRYPLNAIPPALAMGIADTRLADDEVTLVLKGAFLATHKEAAKDPKVLTKARDLWKQAASQGADIQDLPEVLDDRYELMAKDLK